jgi:hypothetical protein
MPLSLPMRRLEFARAWPATRTRARPAAVSAWRTCSVVALLLTSAAASWAQNPKLRPGLWEQTVAMKSQSGQMEAAMAQMHKSLANMPPAQRKQMEDMLAQQGVRMGAGGNSVRMCLSPEQADLGSIPPQEGCTQKVQRTGGSTVSVTFSCKGRSGQPPTVGEGSLTFAGLMAYTGQFKVQTTTAQGQPEVLDMSQSGRWLAADCGGLKPVR